MNDPDFFGRWTRISRIRGSARLVGRRSLCRLKAGTGNSVSTRSAPGLEYSFRCLNESEIAGRFVKL
jgi:hypothetical protein